MNKSTLDISPIEYCGILDLAYILVHAASTGAPVPPAAFMKVRDSLMILRQDMAERNGIPMDEPAFESPAYAAAIMCREMALENDQA